MKKYYEEIELTPEVEAATDAALDSMAGMKWDDSDIDNMMASIAYRKQKMEERMKLPINVKVLEMARDPKRLDAFFEKRRPKPE